MGLRDWVTNTTEKKPPKRGLITRFYSDTVLDPDQREEIKNITLPPEIQAFTTGTMPFKEDGSHPEISVRFDAYRNENGGWDIRRFREAKESAGLAAAGITAGEDDAFVGHALCDFDALRLLSEESAARGFRSKIRGVGYEDLPHWKTVAAQIKQPLDKNGIVQPVVKGQVLADNVTFDDPKQIEIRNATRSPAIAAPAAVQTQTKPAHKSEAGFLKKIFSRMTGRSAALSAALIKAAEEGNKERVIELLASGANVNAVNKWDNTALLWATRHGHTESVRLLIEAGANVNAVNKWGSTALIWAADEGHTEIVRLLMKANANVNIADEDGDTALMWAAGNGRTEIAQMLIKANVNVNAANSWGDTALMMAERNGYKDIVALIHDHQKRNAAASAASAASPRYS